MNGDRADGASGTSKDGASRKKRSYSYLILVLNAALLFCAAALYGRYTAVYQERLREENLGNIANLNQSAASNATALIESWAVKLGDIAQYAARHGTTEEALLAHIDDTNASDDRYFELIDGDYAGYLARRTDGSFPPVSYAGSSYRELQKVFDDVDDLAFGDVCFAPEFTEYTTALKFFALYRHIPIQTESGGTEIRTLLLATKSRDVLAVFNSQDDFSGQSTVLTDASGNYIISNGDFKSTNLLQYLYVYNDLTLDERNGIQREMTERGSGELYYKNAVGEDCVFRYERMTTNGWYCVTSVPLSSFRTPVFNINYAVYAAIVLLVLMAVDMLWLRSMNKRLRVSMLHEKEASEAKTDFLSRMSHDIRTPLNGIIGLTALAMDEKNPPRTAEYLENINVSGVFLLGLVNDILDMSRVESGRVELHPEPYTCADFCRYVDAVVLPLCKEKGVELRLTAPGNEETVLLDRLRFNQIFFNLLSNAVKFTPAGGLVELYWKQTPLPDGRSALDFTVRDNGIGMSEEFQKHMFESFAQEHAGTATTGSGLGLSIVRSLVRLMGGDIAVKSKQGEGTTFTVHLEADVCAASAEAPEAVEKADLAGKRVLLCEDNAVNVMVAERLLQKWGVTVETAENGRIGLERFSASDEGAFNAVLMDIMMPEMNGLDATRAIRALPRSDAATVPIIAMTANAYDMDVQNCLAAGMNAHVGKPIDPVRLRELLSDML